MAAGTSVTATTHPSSQCVCLQIVCPSSVWNAPAVTEMTPKKQSYPPRTFSGLMRKSPPFLPLSSPGSGGFSAGTHLSCVNPADSQLALFFQHEGCYPDAFTRNIP
jgi:hypothetical protein